MANIPNWAKIMLYFLLLFSVDFKLSKQINPYNMSIEKNNEDLEIFNISYFDGRVNCEALFPSLLTPIFLVNNQKFSGQELGNLDVLYPMINKKQALKIFLFNYTFDIYGKAVLGDVRYSKLTENVCYFGLSSKKGNYSIIDDTYFLLKNMIENKKIKKNIFSFDNWTLDNDNFLNTTFYLGEDHYNFVENNKEGIIGECKVREDYDFWGCLFTEMSFNGKTKELKKINSSDYYNFYFSTETHDIIFPLNFLTEFNDLTNCFYDINNDDINNYATCENFFNDENYASLQLTSDNMIITIEIDNQNRFCEYNKEKNNLSRIKFEDIDFFIFPLIMFKRFDIQFDAQNDKIQFYTKNISLLKLKKEKENNSSKVGIVFLIIFIIILILALGFGGFWFIKKRRGSVEKNINKYNKFDEDENFQNMNEKRVF